jgi:hypothetical protein
VSYVLEALKKQEAEQNPDVAVSLSLATERSRRYRLLTWLVGATLLVNAGILFWLLAWPQLQKEQAQKAPAGSIAEPTTEAGSDTRSANRPAASTASGPQSPAAGADASQPSAATLPATPVAQAAPTPEAAKPPPVEPVKAEPVRDPVQLDRLPPDVRRRFPGLAFSTHVYAEDRDLRAVVANGRRLTEGDSLRGVTVNEITETGVVLAFDGFLIEVPVVGSWD